MIEERSAEPNRAPTPLRDLAKGGKVRDAIYLLESLNFKQTRDGKYFLQMYLRDRTGSVRAVRWEATEALYRSLSGGAFVRVSGRVEEFQQNPQVVVDSIAPVGDDSIPFEEFLPHSERPIDEMERELVALVESVENPHLRGLLEAILDDSELRRGLLRAPAGKTLHHAYLGGLLEHVLSIARSVDRLAPNYPELDRDVLIAASILHDIGKVRELQWGGAFGYTDRGQLVGHIGIGLGIIAEKVASVSGFPAELHAHVEHIVASHHGEPERGALKQPMTPEATAFHALDDLDAKLASLRDMRRSLSDAPESRGESTGERGRWSEFKPSLGRRFFFPS